MKKRLNQLLIFLKQPDIQPEQTMHLALEAADDGMSVLFAGDKDEAASDICIEEQSVRSVQEEEAWHLLKKNPDGALAVTADLDGLKKLQKLNVAVIVACRPGESVYGADLAAEGFEEIDLNTLKKVFARHHGIPLTIAVTGRCIIRESVMEDLDAFYDIYGDVMARRFLPPLSDDRESERNRLQAYIRTQYAFYDYGFWTVEERRTGLIIGRAGFDPGPEEGTAWMGYLIRDSFRRKGLGEEVCRAVLDYARERDDLSEILLLTDRENTASIRLAANLGFEKCGFRGAHTDPTKDCFFIKI